MYTKASTGRESIRKQPTAPGARPRKETKTGRITDKKKRGEKDPSQATRTRKAERRRKILRLVLRKTRRSAERQKHSKVHQSTPKETRKQTRKRRQPARRRPKRPGTPGAERRRCRSRSNNWAAPYRRRRSKSTKDNSSSGDDSKHAKETPHRTTTPTAEEKAKNKIRTIEKNMTSIWSQQR